MNRRGSHPSTGTDILAINGGSSSIRFALYVMNDGAIERKLHGKLDRIGSSRSCLMFTDSAGNRQVGDDIGVLDHRSAAHFLLDWLPTQHALESVRAVGHRVVHGM